MDYLSHGSGSGCVAHLAEADLSHVEPLRLDAHPGEVAPDILQNIFITYLLTHSTTKTCYTCMRIEVFLKPSYKELRALNKL